MEVRSALEPVGRLREWLTAPSRLAWVAPVLVYLLVRHEPQRVHTFLEALLGLGFVILVAKYPFRALTVFLIFLPFELITFSLLLHFGVPAQLLRGLGFWKEGVIAGLAVAALRKVLQTRPRLDWADRLILAYLVLGLAYLIVPHLFLSPGAVGANFTFYARELGWRSAVMYPGLFVVCRHLRFAKEETASLVRNVVATGTVIALIGFYEFFRPSSFNHFLVSTAHVPEYKAEVLSSPVGTPGNLLTYASNGHVRIGSVFIDNLTDGWYYVLIIGLVVELITRRGLRFWLLFSLAAAGTALVFTQARASLAAGGIALLFGLRAQIGRSLSQRVRMTSLVVLLLFAAIPLVVFSGLAHRFVSSHQSNQGHQNGITLGLRVMEANPLGRGLSTGTGAGQQAAQRGLISSADVFDPENQWLLVGTQLGVLALVLYSGSIIVVFRRLRPDSADPALAEVSTASAGLRNALLGLMFGTVVAQPFIDNTIAWTTFALCGLAVGAVERQKLDSIPRSRTSDVDGSGVALMPAK